MRPVAQVSRRKNPFPGVSRVIDRHGQARYRFRKKGFSCYLPGAYGSVEFRSAYDAAEAGSKTPYRSTAQHGSVDWLIEVYRASPRYKNLSETRKRSLRGELDWIRRQAGDLPLKRLKTQHIEALMAKKDGPAAANMVKKNMSMLFNFAIKRDLGATFNPARFADKLKINPDGFHTWTDAEIERFLAFHAEGTKARLACLLALNTGMSRQDLTRVGWQNVSGTRISYRRGKTDIGADLPILDDLARELDRLPRDQLLFINHGKRALPYKPETLGNWFRKQCKAAGVKGALHGLRKAGATRLATNGATPDEIRAFLAHATNAEGATYTGKADRARLADSGMAKLAETQNEQKLSNLNAELDKRNANSLKGKG